MVLIIEFTSMKLEGQGKRKQKLLETINLLVEFFFFFQNSIIYAKKFTRTKKNKISSNFILSKIFFNILI